MNLTPAQKIRLGTFLLVSLGLVATTLLVLTGMRLWEPRATFRTRFKESVSGLERNAPVKYQGLRIGRVEAMHIAVDDPASIEVVLSVDPSSVLFDGTSALLDSSGLTGLKSINLTPGDPRKARLLDGAMLPTGPSLIDQLTGSATSIVADVRRVADQLSQLANDENRRRLETLLGGLGSFIGHLDAMATAEGAPFADLIHDVGTTTVAIGETSVEASKMLRTMRGSFDETQRAVVATLETYQRPLRDVDPKEVARTVTAIRGAATKLNERLAADETGRAISSLGETLSKVNHLIQDVDLAVRAGREDFTASLSYMRQAAEDLREFSRILAQNPSVLVRGRGESE